MFSDSPAANIQMGISPPQEEVAGTNFKFLERRYEPGPQGETRVSGRSSSGARRGKLDVTTGPIHAEVGEVPVRVALPFMRGRRVFWPRSDRSISR